MIATRIDYQAPRTFSETEVLFNKCYELRHSEMDQYGLIKPVALWSYLLDTSILHVKALKFSYWDMKSLGVTWALRKAHFHVNRYAQIGESLTIQTYSHSTRRYFTQRDYKVYDERGELVAWMSSEWLLMGTRDRSLRDIEKTLVKLPDNDQQSLLNPLSHKLKVSEREDFQETLDVRFSSIDFNGHVSNADYLKWMLNQIPEHVHRKRVLSDFYIQYRKEIMEGQKIHVGLKENHGHDFLHTIKDDHSEVLAIAKSLWQARP